MRKAEKAVTKILATLNIKGGPRMVWIPRKLLRELLIVAYKSGLADGLEGDTIPRKRRGQKGKRCRT